MANMIGKMPGLMSPTASINVTLGCAITVWVFYHLMGLREQGVVNYLKHFVCMPGAPLLDRAAGADRSSSSATLSRVMSLSLRLFGNIFGEEMVVADHRAASCRSWRRCR